MIVLRPHQVRAIDALVAAKRGVCVAPAGSGKTLIGSGAIKKSVEQDGFMKWLWIANTTEQKHQAAEAMEMLRPVRHLVRVWVRHALHVDDLPLDEMDGLVADEGHHAPAEFWSSSISHCRNLKRVIGLTATLHREDGLTEDILRILGPVVCRITPAEVAECGMLMVPKVTFHGVASEDCMVADVERHVEKEWLPRQQAVLYRCRKTGEDVDEALEAARRQATYQKAMKYALTEFEPRLGVTVSVIRQALRMQRHVLALVYSVEQGRAIMGQVEGSRLVFSQMKVNTDGRRREIVDAFRSGHVKCLIATSLADEGLDVPKADCLVLAGGGRGVSKHDCIFTGEKRATSKIEQRTARVLRVLDGKRDAEVHDFLDRQHPMLRAASWSRMKAYKMLGYEVGVMPR